MVQWPVTPKILVKLLKWQYGNVIEFLVETKEFCIGLFQTIEICTFEQTRSACWPNEDSNPILLQVEGGVLHAGIQGAGREFLT